MAFNFLGAMDWSYLPIEIWFEIYGRLTVNDTVQSLSASFGMLSLGGGFEALTRAHQDYYRLLDFNATIQQELAIRALQDELFDAFYADEMWAEDSD